jgi:hypothetical protein
MTKTWLIIPAALLTLTLVSSAMALQIGDKAPAFKLLDQFGKVWELAALKNNVVVVVAANRDSGPMMAPWMDGLKSRYTGKIKLLGLMDLKGIPSIGRGIARSRIRRETSDPLMVDFDGPTGSAYMVSSKYPVVVVIDKGGIVRALEKTHTASAASAVNAAIDKAL